MARGNPDLLRLASEAISQRHIPTEKQLSLGSALERCGWGGETKVCGVDQDSGGQLLWNAMTLSHIPARGLKKICRASLPPPLHLKSSW